MLQPQQNDKPAFIPRDHLKPGRPARDDNERAVLHAEIARRYAQPLKDCSDQRRIAVLRRRDLETLYRVSDVPEDSGLDWLDIAANHLAFIYRKSDAKIAAILLWRARFTPMVEVGIAKELAERVITDPRMPKADELAHRLGLTMATRTELRITTIGAVDCSKAKRKTRRRNNDAARHRALRAKDGAKPHAASHARTRPWNSLGISRRTYYRRRQNGTDGTNSSAAHTKYVGLPIVALDISSAPRRRGWSAPVDHRARNGKSPEAASAPPVATNTDASAPGEAPLSAFPTPPVWREASGRFVEARATALTLMASSAWLRMARIELPADVVQRFRIAAPMELRP